MVNVVDAPIRSHLGVMERTSPGRPTRSDLLCFSHLRWNFVLQRPQHLLSRFARERRVFFFEEPVWTDDSQARLEVHRSREGVWVAVPQLPKGLSHEEVVATQRALVRSLLAGHAIRQMVAWYYTP